MTSIDSALRNEGCLSTYSGKKLHPLVPELSQIDIEDIAHGLAYQGCFRGQTHYYYSVAQHSLIVASLVPVQYRLAALLHDATVAYFGEMTPLIRQLLPDISRMEKSVMAAIGEKFGIAEFDSKIIERAHLIAAATEQRDLRPHFAKPSSLAPIPRSIDFMSPEEAKYQFIELFNKLSIKLRLVSQTSSGRQEANQKSPTGQSKKSRQEAEAKRTVLSRREIFTQPAVYA